MLVGGGAARLALITLICTVLLIGLGGMVTSTGSGMAFKDWPLANGSVWPENMTLAGYFEHVHRLLGALVGVLVVILAIWIGVREERRWLRWLAVGLLLTVIAQGVIGGVGVLKNLPAITSVTHAVLAQITLAMMALLVFALSRVWHTPALALEVPVARRAARWALLTVVTIVVQVLIGAVARHTGSNHALWTHVLFFLVPSLLAMMAAGYAAGRMGAAPGIRGNSIWVYTLLGWQIVLGFIALAIRTGKHPENVEFLLRSGLITSHQLMGALLFMTVALLLFRVRRAARASLRA